MPELLELSLPLKQKGKKTTHKTLIWKDNFTKQCPAARGGRAAGPGQGLIGAQLRGETSPSAQLLLTPGWHSEGTAHKPFPGSSGEKPLAGRKGQGVENNSQQLGKLGAAPVGCPWVPGASQGHRRPPGALGTQQPLAGSPVATRALEVRAACRVFFVTLLFVRSLGSQGCSRAPRAIPMWGHRDKNCPQPWASAPARAPRRRNCSRTERAQQLPPPGCSRRVQVVCVSSCWKPQHPAATATSGTHAQPRGSATFLGQL